MSRKRANLFSGADITRKIAMILNICAMGVVVIFAIYKAINTPEKMVKDHIAGYAREYYEEYLYPKIKNGVDSDKFEETMRYYAEHGIDDAHVSLRQLMLYDGGHFSKDLDAISDYCNIDQTFVSIYPENPYEKNNYRVKYNYSCKF